MQQDRQPVIVIDLIRCGCALLVLLYHYGANFWLGPSSAQAVLLAGVAAPGIRGDAIVQAGWIGVELFFVISGMVIARSAAGVPAAVFARRRLLRLVPAMWICASLTLLVLAGTTAAGADLGARWGRSVAFWPWGEQIDGSYWTLAIELAFYALVAGALATGREAAAVGDLLTLCALAFWLPVLVAGDAAVPFGFSRGMQLLLLPHGCLFALGIVLARAPAEGWTRAIAIRAALLVALCVVEIGAHAVERSTAFHRPVGTGMPVALFLAGVVLLAFAGRLQPILARRIAPGVARTLGIMTYPLYLLHQEIGAVLIARTAPAVGTGPAMLLAAALVVAIAWAVARHAEPLLRAVLARALAPRPAAVATAR